MLNGHHPAMNVFTKLLKAPFLLLRKRIHPSVAFLGDTYLQGGEFTECKEKVLKTVKRLRCLGFIMNPDKSILEPTQELTCLDFVINSK